MELKGVAEVTARLKKAGVVTTNAVGYGLVRGGQLLQALSQEICPVQTGNLRASAFTRKIKPTEVIVGYTADYAVFVHENLDGAHGKAFNILHADEIAGAGKMMTNKKGRVVFVPTSKAGTAKGGMFPRGENQSAKFLEKPMRQNRGEIIDVVVDEAKRYIK